MSGFGCRLGVARGDPGQEFIRQWGRSVTWVVKVPKGAAPIVAKTTAVVLDNGDDTRRFVFLDNMVPGDLIVDPRAVYRLTSVDPLGGGKPIPYRVGVGERCEGMDWPRLAVKD